jgi:hypothetical protein
MAGEPIHDLAHIGHAELMTPFAQQSLDFFTELFGMESSIVRGSPSTSEDGATTSATASN